MIKVLPKNIAIEWHNLGDVYFAFATYFISIVVGKKKFKNFCCKFPMLNFVSVSDETFALLIYENNNDRWMSMAVNDP